MHVPAVRSVVCASRTAGSRRWMHASRAARAITTMQMPAMSPTMKEGGIASWKVKEGGSFSAGDVLLEIETDKATIDVEAQEDGVLGKIILGDGSKNVPVGKLIALLAEEGDDISNLEIPKEEAAAPPASESKPEPSPPPVETKAPETPAEPKSHGRHPTHRRPLFPSVLRLLVDHGVSDADIAKIKGTGVRGMLTKGDVLAHLGKASSPLGSYKPPVKETAAPATAQGGKKDAPKPLDGQAIRMLIVSNMLAASQPKAPAMATTLDFDSIIDDYLPRPTKPREAASAIPPPASKAPMSDYLEGLI